MAKRLEQGPPHGRNKYPWETWSDGAWWEVQFEKDFTCGPASFRAALSRAAATLGKKVTTRSTDSGIAFRFFSIKEPKRG